MKIVRFVVFVCIGAMAVAGAPINGYPLNRGGEAALCTEKIVSSGIWVNVLQSGRRTDDPIGYRMQCMYQRFNPLPENPCEKGLIIHETFLLKLWLFEGDPCRYRIRCCPNIADTSQDVSQ